MYYHDVRLSLIGDRSYLQSSFETTGVEHKALVASVVTVPGNWTPSPFQAAPGLREPGAGLARAHGCTGSLFPLA